MKDPPPQKISAGTAATMALGGNVQGLFNVRVQGGEVVADERKYKGKVPLHDQYGPEAKYAVEAEALLPTTKHEEEIAGVFNY